MTGALKSLHLISPATIFERKQKGCHDASMISPVWDFFFVGGLSFFFLPLLFFPDIPVTQRIFLISFSIGFIVNYPHFMHSYQLLYHKFFSTLIYPQTAVLRKVRMTIGGIIAPVALIAFLLAGAIQEDQNLLGYATNILFFLVGWHYVKQGYGVLITLSVRKQVFYSGFEKKVLLLNAYICWLTFWCRLNTYVYEDIFYSIPYETFAVPGIFYTAGIIGSILFSVLSFGLLALKFIRHRQICINGIVGYGCAIYIWLLIVFFHPVLFYFFPALHSLQYLLFVWKMKYEKEREEYASLTKEEARMKTAKSMRNFLGVAIFLGALGFYLIPNLLDNIVTYNAHLMGPELFMYMFVIFINVHHYFIDFAIWRKDNPDMKYLFK